MSPIPVAASLLKLVSLPALLLGDLAGPSLAEPAASHSTAPAPNLSARKDSQPVNADLRDRRLGVLGLAALTRDPALEPLNLGVSVRDGRACIWGTVPSAELARRAEEAVSRVPGILSVGNELLLLPADDPTAIHLSLPGSRSGSQASDLAPFAWTHSVSRPRVPAAAADEVAVLRPIRVPSQPDRFDPVRRIEELRQSDSRFQALEAVLEGTTVRIRGVARDWKDVHDLADQVSLVPGVERVLLDGVRTANP